MPELPDISGYLEALAPRVLDETLEKIRAVSISLLRTVDPPLSEFEGLCVRSLRRLGKRIVFGFEEERFLVIHLMIAGRLHWRPRGAKPPGKRGHAAFDFPRGTLLLTADLESDGLAILTRQPPPAGPVVVQLPHHGRSPKDAATLRNWSRPVAAFVSGHRAEDHSSSTRSLGTLELLPHPPWVRPWGK